MTAEIIAVGTELLLGDVLNTNAQFVARGLADLGISVYYQTVVGDNAPRLNETVRLALSRSDLLILTGGLGPTEDDLTKQTVAAAFGDRLVLNEKELAVLQTRFASAGRTMAENNRKQAYVPAHGLTLHNANGTAPGVVFMKENKRAILLPGPPGEMRPMFTNQVVPLLQQQQDSVLHSRTLRVFGIGESDLENLVAPLLTGANPTAALYAKPGEVHIRITAKAGNAAQAEEMCAALARQFTSILGDFIYAQNGQSLEEVLVEALAAAQQTIATAESCTGGLISSRITSVPGASAVFGFGLCSYANATKQQTLGVREETLATFGAVSPQTAAEMAQGARRAGAAHYGLSVTGIAGPTGGSEEKPVGLVYIGLASPNSVWVKKVQAFNRSRDSVRETATLHALDMARRAALGLSLPAEQVL